MTVVAGADLVSVDGNAHFRPRYQIFDEAGAVLASVQMESLSASAVEGVAAALAEAHAHIARLKSDIVAIPLKN